jgi:hypothetical protein
MVYPKLMDQGINKMWDVDRRNLRQFKLGSSRNIWNYGKWIDTDQSTRISTRNFEGGIG